ncbi:MAG: hypothetical protein LIP16_21315 [Clostridium sp.]|nr:hypothetical protein [Clostridium sp.]
MENRTKAYIFGGMFLSLMVLPRLLFIPLKDYVDTENYEKRVYQEKPELTLRGLKEYPGLYDAYFNDHLAFKNPIVAFGKLADIRVFGEVSSDSVLMGKDNWMFYRVKGYNEDNMADYQGTNHYTQEQLEQLSLLLDQADGRLESRGIRLILYIVPNKEQVYGEYMPSSIKVINKESRAELLYSYLREHSRGDVYYPLEDFRQAKEDWRRIYFKYDTHWNGAGAFMAAQMIIKDIDGEAFGPEDYRDFKIERTNNYSGDLAAMLNLQTYYNDDDYLRVMDYREEVHFEMDYENERETITHYSSDVQDDHRKILICRDSFGIHMAEYFAKNYPDVTLMDYRTENYAEAVCERKPDVVVVEIAERYADYLPEILQNLAAL